MEYPWIQRLDGIYIVCFFKNFVLIDTSKQVKSK